VHTRYDVRIFVKECTSLAAAGYEVSLIVNDGQKNEIKNGVNIISTQYIAQNRIDRILNSTREIYKKAIEVNADLYHFHDPELLLIASKLKRKGKVVVFDSHEFTGKQIECREYLNKSFRKLLSFFYLKYEKHVLKKIDAVIVPCTYNGVHYFEKKCKREVLVDNLPILEEVLLNRELLDAGEKKACYIGSLSEERGIKKIVEASSLIKIPLLLAGNFSPAHLEREIVDSEKNPQVSYLGVVDRTGIKKILSEAYMGMCVLQDSGQYKFTDNLPTKVCEYMAAGIPIIVSDFPYSKKMIDKYKCGIYVNPNDTHSIANAMKWLLENPKEAKEMGKNGRNLVETKLNWKFEVKKIILLYESLLS